MADRLINSVMDTAHWVAHHRATESERPDALFRDPYARRLAGERGELIARNLDATAYVAVRTRLFDQLLQEHLACTQVEMVVNLAAGLDTRPYRLDLPPCLRWIEVDLPDLVDFKTAAMRGETAHCSIEVIGENLANASARRSLLSRLAAESDRAVVLSEGLLIYLAERDVTELATDMRDLKSFRHWIVEVMSPKMIKTVNEGWGAHLSEAGTPMRFAPPDWRSFYTRLGWKPVAFRDFDQLAQEVGRAPPRAPARWPALAKARSVTGDMLLGRGRHGAYESGVAVLERR